jgi:hypothetical protein
MKIPKGSGQVERLPPGVDLDHGTKGRPVAFENRQTIGRLVVKPDGGESL